MWCIACNSLAAYGQAPLTPPPLTLKAVVEAAVLHRGEIAAAHARAQASAQRPAIDGALEDPMISPSIDHYPFDMMEDEGGNRYDWSVAIEQRLPLSGVRAHKRRAARAQAAVALAGAERTVLDVIAEAQRAFIMLRERRQMREVLDRQLALGREIIDSAAARYSSGTGSQADVLRAEVDEAGLAAQRRSIDAQIRSAEAMLNVSMGLPVTTPVGELADPLPHTIPQPSTALSTALDRRPELREGEAEVERALADIDVMRSMYRPMLSIRVGRASTMAEGPGAMLMIGVSVPLWRDRLRAGVAEARFMERMARADLDAMKLMVSGEVAMAIEEYRSAEELARTLEVEVVPRATMAVDAALSGYSTGRGALASVTDATGALWRVRAQLVMAHAQLGLAAIQLERALGTRAWIEPTP
jgi:cobalt-zinc-cadmium efflux system outer membrane protein